MRLEKIGDSHRVTVWKKGTKAGSVLGLLKGGILTLQNGAKRSKSTREYLLEMLSASGLSWNKIILK